MPEDDSTAGLDRWLEDRCGVNDKPKGKCSCCDTPDAVDPNTGICDECGAKAVGEPEEMEERCKKEEC